MSRATVSAIRAGRLLMILLVVAVLANDGAKSLAAFRAASGGMNDAMNAAADAVRTNPGVSAEPVAAQAAASQGGTLERYDQAIANNAASVQVRVNLAVSAPLGRTYVVAPIIGLATNVPSAQWYSPGAVKITLHTSKLVTQLGLAP